MELEEEDVVDMEHEGTTQAFSTAKDEYVRMVGGIIVGGKKGSVYTVRHIGG